MDARAAAVLIEGLPVAKAGTLTDLCEAVARTTVGRPLTVFKEEEGDGLAPRIRFRSAR
jgi:hypothetical protein